VICRCLFFFQAEDGIRDFHVTGVQTCALPISAEDTVVVTIVHVNRAPVADAGEAFSVNEREGGQLQGSGTDPDGDTVTYAWTQRSEERRVGKECSCRRARRHETNRRKR